MLVPPFEYTLKSRSKPYWTQRVYTQKFLHVKHNYTSTSLSGSSFLSFFSIGKYTSKTAPISLMA